MSKPIFPPIFLQRTPKSHQEALVQYAAQYDAGVASGTYTPFTYPSATFGAALLLLFMLIPPTSILHNRLTRLGTFLLSTVWHIWLIFNCKSFNPAVGFAIGLICAWGISWTAVLLIFHDSKNDFQRLVRKDLLEPWKSIDSIATEATEATTVLSRDHDASQSRDKTGLHQRKPLPNGDPSPSNGKAGTPDRASTQHAPRPSYSWQPYPLCPLNQRLDYVVDLITCFRGIGWSWKVPGLPSYPSPVTATLSPITSKESDASKTGSPGSLDITDKPISRSGIPRFDTYWSVILHNAWLVTKGYFAIDLIMTTMNQDPYFWGLVTAPPPAYFPFTLVRNSFFLTRCYRLFVSMSAVWLGLRTIFAFAPLFYVGFLSIWPGIENVFVNSKAEPWLYPDHFGAYSNVFERGLAGWWGGWWHQTFRYAFQAFGAWVCRILGLPGNDRKNKVATVVQVVAAFAMSGWLHAAASVTQMGETRPFWGSFMFFFVQPVGIMAEMAGKDWLRRKGYTKSMPRWIAKLCNFIWVHLWFFVTGPLLTDDFARGGLWLFEPVMISVFRGFGFGPKGDGWYCWNMLQSVRWHWDDRWWMSGIAI